VSTRSFKELFEEAETHPDFHRELAILEFTEELSRVMRDKDVSGTELARRIGSSQAYISRVLNGGANFTLGSMTKLAMALDVQLKMHLAPSRAGTAWRDFYPAAKVTGAGADVIEVSFPETRSEPASFAAAATTPHVAPSITDEGMRDGAAASAA
jgi:transcriptional regulator with XRE-family HTH domain